MLFSRRKKGRMFMDYRKKYEVLLQKQCDAYQEMLYLMTQISKYDDDLFECSNMNEPDTDKLRSITTQKELCVRSLDTLSLDTEHAKFQLCDILEVSYDICTHPFYQRMQQLQELARMQLQALLDKEDKNNPSITQRLTAYKERLETDIKIREIPMEKRKIFFVFP